MAPVKPRKRTQSTQRVRHDKNKIKRESVKRESIPTVVASSVLAALRGVHWERNVPGDCKKGVRNSRIARKSFTLQSTIQLARQNKFVVAARWMYVKGPLYSGVTNLVT
jgi:hypothetical protein